MKILHIWNTAGVGSLLAYFMDKLFGTKSWVVMRKKLDPFGLTTFGESWECGGKIFTLKALWMAKNYELIHVHSFDRIIPFLKMIYPKKPVILHYHGSDIRDKWNQKKYWKKADKVLISTPDLLDGAPEEAILLSNPVNIEKFKSLTDRSDNSAIYIIKNQIKENLEWPSLMAHKHGLKISFRDRIKNPIPHSELPMLLNQYTYFIDRDYVKSLSKTALEALACGCKVVNFKGEIVTKLPRKHNPEVVTKRLAEIYNETANRYGIKGITNNVS